MLSRYSTLLRKRGRSLVTVVLQKAEQSLIDEDSECSTARRRLLTIRWDRYIIGDKSKEGQDGSS
jgi:hypothetical protein